MRAGVAVGRALLSSLRGIPHPTPFSSPPPTLLSSSSIGVFFKRERDVLRSMWSHPAAPFAYQAVMDQHPPPPSRAFMDTLQWRHPRPQNLGFLQRLTAQASTQTRTQTPPNTNLSSEFKPPSASVAPSASRSSSPPPPSTSTGKQEERPKGKKAGVVKQMLWDFGAVPFPALALGIAGLAPFVALAPPFAQMLPLPEILAAGHAEAQAAYGASIVSFLGAIHWGLAMADYAAPGKGGVANMTLMTSRYVWSVVPSLMAWTALLLPATTKFAALIFSLWMVLGVDFVFARLKLVPYWFMTLRWPLTFVASVSMIPSLLTAAAWN